MDKILPSDGIFCAFLKRHVEHVNCYKNLNDGLQ